MRERRGRGQRFLGAGDDREARAGEPRIARLRRLAGRVGEALGDRRGRRDAVFRQHRARAVVVVGSAPSAPRRSSTDRRRARRRSRVRIGAPGVPQPQAVRRRSPRDACAARSSRRSRRPSAASALVSPHVLQRNRGRRIRGERRSAARDQAGARGRWRRDRRRAPAAAWRLPSRPHRAPVPASLDLNPFRPDGGGRVTTALSTKSSAPP